MRQSGVRSCNIPGLHRHLVQELNVGTVGRNYLSDEKRVFEKKVV